MKNRLQTYSTSDLKRAPDFSTYNKTLEILFIYNRFLNQQKPTRTRLSVDRAVDRPYAPVDRAVDRAPNRELGHFSRSTGRSTDLHPCACCARRSTGPVDRSSATAGGRSGRSTDLLLLLLLTCFAAAASFVFRRRLSRRSLSTSLIISSLFPTILHLGEDSSKSEPNCPSTREWLHQCGCLRTLPKGSSHP